MPEGIGGKVGRAALKDPGLRASEARTTPATPCFEAGRRDERGTDKEDLRRGKAISFCFLNTFASLKDVRPSQLRWEGRYA